MGFDERNPPHRSARRVPSARHAAFIDPMTTSSRRLANNKLVSPRECSIEAFFTTARFASVGACQRTARSLRTRLIAATKGRVNSMSEFLELYPTEGALKTIPRIGSASAHYIMCSVAQIE